MVRSIAFAAAAAAALLANVAWSAAPRGEVISDTAAIRHGLTRAWFTQVQMDVGRSRVRDVVLDDDTLFVQTDRAMIQAINAETGRTLWSKQVGKPNHPTMTPGVSRDLVVVLNGSRLFALNRANGDLLYEIQVSGPPGAGAAVSAKRAYVPMLNGMVVAYRLESMTDPLKELGKIRDSSKPAGKGKDADKQADEEPQMSEEERAKAEQLRRENLRLRQEFIPPLSCQSAGHAIVQPLVLTQDDKDEFAAWVTDRGHLNVSQIKLLSQDMLSVAYRHELAPGVVMRPAYSPPDPRIGDESGVVFAASHDGFVHGIYERSGDPMWRFSAGGPIVESPTLVDTAIYVPLQLGGMYCLDAKTGVQRWFAPGIMKFFAVSKERVYAADRFGRLQILNAKTGAKLDNMPLPNSSIAVANDETDRIYVASESGLVQCLREVEAVKPLLHREAREQAEKEKEVEKPAAAKQKDGDEPEAEEKPAGKKPAPKAKVDAEPGDANPLDDADEGAPAGKPKPKAPVVKPKPVAPKPKTAEPGSDDDIFK